MDISLTQHKDSLEFPGMRMEEDNRNWKFKGIKDRTSGSKISEFVANSNTSL